MNEGPNQVQFTGFLSQESKERERRSTTKRSGEQNHSTLNS